MGRRYGRNVVGVMGIIEDKKMAMLQTLGKEIKSHRKEAAKWR